jgi:hypothetical protein
VADLLKVETVAQYIGLSDPSPDLDLIDRLIDAAKDAIEAMTARSLATATTYTEYHDAGRAYIYVRVPPIVSITNLYDDAQTSARSIGSDDWIDDTDDSGQNYRAGKVELWNDESSFGGDRLDAKVVYVGGWTTSTIPQDLLQAWVELVSFWYNNTERTGIRSASQGGQSVQYDENHIPKPLQSVFRRYSIARNW